MSMVLRDAPPVRPSAAWISRYAAGLLSAAPTLQPLDAVRMALDACGDAAPRQALKPPPEPKRGLPRR
jgi:hypothetical protein